MGHAINLAMPKVKTRNFFLIWAINLVFPLKQLIKALKLLYQDQITV